MKATTTLFLLLLSFSFASAQTTLTAAMNLAPVGTTDTVRMATGVAPGASGNGVVWDFSTTPVTAAGVVRMVSPATTTYTATFPTATHAMELLPFGSTSPMYEYLLKNNSGIYILASSYSTATPGDNYTANTKLRIPFPFSFGSSITDTFQKTGSSPDAYTLTYDGFGTLKTPGGNFNNVVRIKYVWMGGEVAYQWFTTAPLAYLASWSDGSGGKLSLLGGSAAMAVADVAESDFKVYPNPARDGFQLALPAGFETQTALVCRLYNGNGTIVGETAIKGGKATLPRNGLPTGVYFYEVQEAGRRIGGGRLIFE